MRQIEIYLRRILTGKMSNNCYLKFQSAKILRRLQNLSQKVIHLGRTLTFWIQRANQQFCLLKKT